MPVVVLDTDAASLPLLDLHEMTHRGIHVRSRAIHRLLDDRPDSALRNSSAMFPAVIHKRSTASRTMGLASQTMFWTPEWQAGEREADVQEAAGVGETFESGEAFLDALRARAKPAAPRRKR